MVTIALRVHKLILAALTCILLAACASNATINASSTAPSNAQQSAAAEGSDTLFARLGGATGIEQLVVTSLQLLKQDERIGFHFKDTDDPKLIASLSDLICILSDGPCDYEGLDMIEAHAGMNISKAEFDIFVEVFMTAMTRSGIPYPAQNQLLAILASLRVDIIHR